MGTAPGIFSLVSSGLGADVDPSRRFSIGFLEVFRARGSIQEDDPTIEPGISPRARTKTPLSNFPREARRDGLLPPGNPSGKVGGEALRLS